MRIAKVDGASPIPDKGPKAWDTLPLGLGSFDTKAFLKLDSDSGYRGPIRHQIHALKGEDMDKLSSAIHARQEIKPAILGRK